MRRFERATGTTDKAAGPTHVVLVSDGKETCDGGPCALVRALRARDATLTVHVAGFDVTREEAGQLACIKGEFRVPGPGRQR